MTLGKPANSLFLVLVFVVSGLLFASFAFAGDRTLGLSLMPYSKKVEERRYRSSRSFQKTKKYFKKLLPKSKIKWHKSIVLPHIKVVHIENLAFKEKDAGKKWSGINIYAEKGKHTYYYILK